jgi:hypothetical protein
VRHLGRDPLIWLYLTTKGPRRHRLNLSNTHLLGTTRALFSLTEAGCLAAPGRMLYLDDSKQTRLNMTTKFVAVDNHRK